MFNRKLKQMSKWEESAVDSVNRWYEAYVDLAIEHGDFEKLRKIREGGSCYGVSAEQMQKQDSITRKKDLAIEKEMRRIQNISANLLKSAYVSTSTSETNQVDIASKAIDMLIESLGNEAEQATSSFLSNRCVCIARLTFGPTFTQRSCPRQSGTSERSPRQK